MEVYLVGGACRDILMGLTPNDYDYLVVGSSPEEMKSLGYNEVGLDFPVFLHPVTKDEYALARTERKVGLGTNGFDCHWKGVTLEEDLARRDLTINSIAIRIDPEATALLEDDVVLVGGWIDPFNGRQDIRDKVLRATTSAFSEDPLRVLRIARFLARFGPEWHVATSTISLMDEISVSGELELLCPDRFWKETEKALKTNFPSLYFQLLMPYTEIFPMTKELWDTEENNPHHPEANVWVHTAMVMDHAAQTWNNDPLVVWACYTHDFGKPSCYRLRGNGHGHEKDGLPFIQELIDKLRIPKSYKQIALLVCEHHQKVHQALGRNENKIMTPKTVMNLIDATKAMTYPKRFMKILMACESDAAGRGHTEEEKRSFWCKNYPQGPFLEWCLKVVMETDTKSVSKRLLDAGKSGKIIGLEIRAARVNSIRQEIKNWK